MLEYLNLYCIAALISGVFPLSIGDVARDDTRLGGAVGGAAGTRAYAAHRRDIDDPAASSVAHHPRRRLTADEDSGEIDGEHAVPVLERLVEERMHPTDASIADQDIEPPIGGERRRHHGLDLGLPRDIRLDRGRLS